MIPAERREDALQFVEDLGLAFEEMGYPQMTGRVLGWLQLADPPLQSMDELADVLRASKGSISTSTRMLIQMGMIERVAIPGFRRDHFRYRPGAWLELNRLRLARIRRMRELADRGLALEGGTATESASMHEMHRMFIWMEREIAALLKRYEQQYPHTLDEGAA